MTKGQQYHLRHDTHVKKLEMKSALFIAFVVFATLGIPMLSHSSTDTKNIGLSPPIPKFLDTIDISELGERARVKDLSYSPLGTYLAILAYSDPIHLSVIIWNVRLNKKQSQIVCPSGYGLLADQRLLWARNEEDISFGIGMRWNPVSGELLGNNPVVGRFARLNRDGTKMSTIVGAIGGPSYVYIYDTNNWNLRKIYLDGLTAQSTAWTADDEIVVGANGTKETIGSKIDGFFVAHATDATIRLLDSNDGHVLRSIWFPSVPDNRPNFFPWRQSRNIELLETSFASNKIANGANEILDARSLDIKSYYSLEEMNGRERAAGGGRAFSADGKYLYVKDAKWFDKHKPVTNVIVDVNNGKRLEVFSGGDVGIAVSPDGQAMAMGDDNTVEIFSLK